MIHQSIPSDPALSRAGLAAFASIPCCSMLDSCLERGRGGDELARAGRGGRHPCAGEQSLFVGKGAGGKTNLTTGPTCQWEKLRDPAVGEGE